MHHNPHNAYRPFLHRNILLFLIMVQVGCSPDTKTSKADSNVKFDDTREMTWSVDFKIVEIPSTADGQTQKAYFYPTTSETLAPLIVSLHTWSGDFSQTDALAEGCQAKDLNYIHPDFRGANMTRDACCSALVLQDIDDAITYALQHAKVDPDRIYVIGVSGGGYATLSAFMKLQHPVKKFSAWASITDLVAWYEESRIRENKYADNILACTSSKNGTLNDSIAQQKSPMYWPTPANKLSKTKLMIYAGIYDGIQGSVPITHSINFYNKLLSNLSVTDSSSYVSDQEKLQLLEYHKPLGRYGTIADRAICLKKESNNIQFIIFEGNHEMLTEFAFNELLE